MLLARDFFATKFYLPVSYCILYVFLLEIQIAASPSHVIRIAFVLVF